MSSSPAKPVPPSARTVSSIAEIPATDWDRLAQPDPAIANPFVTHAFLKALEDAGTVGGRTGWTPRHVVLERDGRIAGVAPAYLKAHSQGEYILITAGRRPTGAPAATTTPSFKSQCRSRRCRVHAFSLAWVRMPLKIAATLRSV